MEQQETHFCVLTRDPGDAIQHINVGEDEDFGRLRDATSQSLHLSDL